MGPVAGLGRRWQRVLEEVGDDPAGFSLLSRGVVPLAIMQVSDGVVIYTLFGLFVFLKIAPPMLPLLAALR